MAVTFEKIDQAEAWKMFNAAAERLLGISGEQFEAHWNAGDFEDDANPAVMRVAMLHPGGW